MLKQKEKLPFGTLVKIHSLGPSHEGKEYCGVIFGIAVDDLVRIYIVNLTPSSQKEMVSEYPCITITESCLREENWDTEEYGK